MIYDKRLFDYLFDQLQQHPLEKAFGRKVDGEWRYYSTADMIALANRAALGLLRLGLKPGDKVATVVYQTQPEWVVLDYAMLQTGIVNVPMYPTISSREYQYILSESEAQYCIVGDGDLYEKVSKAKEMLPGLKEIFSFDPQPACRCWTVIPVAPDSDFTELEQIRNGIRPDDLATLIYTSGTTGDPKGVMLSHRNIAFNVEAMRRLIPMDPGDRVLSFLPVSHVYERAAIYAFTAYGGSVSFSTPDSLGGDNGDLKLIRPHFFTTVPRLLEKVFERIQAKGNALSGLKRWLFFRAMALADEWDPDKNFRGWKALEWMLVQKLVFSKWREALGNCVKGITTAASACPLRVLRAFNAAGIPVREGYGLTEAAPALSFNGFKAGEPSWLGTVGPALEGITLRIIGDGDYHPGEGEIIAKSPGIMQGYYKQPEKTAEMIRYIDGEPWLVTGDIGMLVPGPSGALFLKITDRKKELLKTSGGKYVAPTPIESIFKEHYLVEQAMVVGENLKFVSALLVVSEEGLRTWCARHAIPWNGVADAIKNPAVIRRYQMLVDRVNPHFGHAEQVKKFTLLAKAWEPVTTDGTEAELTPTLKLKRRVILRKYAAEIEAMYD